MVEKYVGWTVIIMYQDSKGEISQRWIRILGCEQGRVRAYDLSKRSPRLFHSKQILSIQPVSKYAS